MSNAIVIRDKALLRARCDEARREEKRVGFIPTMGALHEGHLSLIRKARRAGADFIVVSIFVNPLQFGENEDLDQYPRTFEDDLAACEEEGVNIVFAPSPETIYAPGFESHVEVESLTLPLEGAYRPGHFRGVTTVVAKLFNMVGPSLAVFGKKDLQQALVIQRMVRDLDMPIEIVLAPTAREADGLALSSRNRYLSTEERTRGLSISRGLREAYDAFHAGERDVARLSELLRASIAPEADSIDYAEVVHKSTLKAEGDAPDDLVGIVAARFGTTRLIDNCIFAEDMRP